jgi:hypothetical protein
MDDINVDIRVIGSGSLNWFGRRFSEHGKYTSLSIKGRVSS